MSILLAQKQRLNVLPTSTKSPCYLVYRSEVVYPNLVKCHTNHFEMLKNVESFLSSPPNSIVASMSTSAHIHINVGHSRVHVCECISNIDFGNVH